MNIIPSSLDQFMQRVNNWLLQVRYLLFRNKDIIIINGMKLIMTVNMDELINMQSVGNCFILGKTSEMVERCIALAQKYRIKKVFDLGIFKGGSVVLYDQIFQVDKIVAIDLIPLPAKALTDYIEKYKKIDSVKPYYGVNQSDSDSMGKILADEFPNRDIDLIIDDASHFYIETREAFNICFPYLKTDGFYIIEDWAWAHWSEEPWQTEKSPFGNTKAMSNLLIELFMLSASRPDLITNIIINFNTIIVRKGSGQLPAKGFNIGQHYLLRGKTFNAWL